MTHVVILLRAPSPELWLPMDGLHMARQSLRERQRMELREEIQRTALQMFADHGFDNVAISEITDDVGVAQRTFYRYFPTKEDAVLSLLDDFAPAIHGHLREHPADGAPWKVLHDAFVAAVRSGTPVDARVMRMIYETPRLLSAYFERQRLWEAKVAEVLAEQLGVDPDSDPRPSLWSSMAFLVVQRATYENVMLGTSPDELGNLEHRFHQAEEFFSGHLA